FISILYLGFFFVQRKPKYLLYSLLLFSSNMFGDVQRFVLIAYFVSIIAAIFIFRKNRVILQLIPFTFIISLLVLASFSSSDFGNEFISKFSDAFDLLDSDVATSSDVSVN